MNILKILAIIAVIIAIAVAVIYLCGQFEQTRFISDGANNLVNTVTKAATDNPAISATLASGGIATVGGVVLDKFNGVKQKVTATQAAANSAIENIKAEKEGLAEQFETTKSQLTEKAAGVQKQFDDYKAEVEPELAKVKGLEQQLQGAQEMHTNFVQQLTEGSQQVIDPATNKVYKVITLEKTVVK